MISALLSRSPVVRTVVVLLMLACGVDAQEDDPPLILAHYMPWYSAKPQSDSWGWHWTMNAFDPETVIAGRREIASHYHPLIGPYDSADSDVLEYQLLTMKIAGIDGVIVDWYGLTDLHDYATLHKNTMLLANQTQRLGLKFLICYEDQTIRALEKAGRIKAAQRVEHAVNEIDWLAEHWFGMNNYVRHEDRPVLLSFGQNGLNNDEWRKCLASMKTKVTYISQHNRRPAAEGAFDWPKPTVGLKATATFRSQQVAWPISIPVAFPRFVDIYAQAKVHESWGRIDDDDGRTFRKSLQQALESKRPMIQIATWNDWGEGTQVEPSHEFGYRDLEVVQELRRKFVDKSFAFQSDDLKLPRQLLTMRRDKLMPGLVAKLNEVAALIEQGETAQAKEILRSIGRNQ